MEPRCQRLVGALLFLIVAVALWLHAPAVDQRQASARPPPPPFSAGLNYTRLHPANSTLGFGAVLAVSRPDSPRQEPLLFASNLTGVDVVVPRQPQWSDTRIDKLRAERGSKITRGSALAWLGHLNALEWFLDSDLETALVIEDDVDWDIGLRNVEVPLASENLRRLLASDSDAYWGAPDRWEILYLGHCGDFFEPGKLDGVQHRVYRDDTLLPHRRMHPRTKTFVEEVGLAEGERMVHQSKWPLCTFGYAVTRASAKRIATELAARETEGGCDAFDVRMLEACRDLGYKCYTVNPELFHHVSVPSEIANVNDGVDNTGRLQPHESSRGTTNIACGARSASFFTKDAATLAYLQKEVGEKGHCLRDPMEEDASKPF